MLILAVFTKAAIARRAPRPTGHIQLFSVVREWRNWKNGIHLRVLFKRNSYNRRDQIHDERIQWPNIETQMEEIYNVRHIVSSPIPIYIRSATLGSWKCRSNNMEIQQLATPVPRCFLPQTFQRKASDEYISLVCRKRFRNDGLRLPLYSSHCSRVSDTKDGSRHTLSTKRKKGATS